MFLKKIPNKLIGELLVEEGYLEPKNLEKGLALQKKEGGLIGDILVKNGWLEESQLVMGLSKQLSLPFIRLTGYSVNREALKLIEREAAERFLMFAFEYQENALSIALSNPLDPKVVSGLEKLASSSTVHIFLALPTEIRQAIKEHYQDSPLFYSSKE